MLAGRDAERAAIDALLDRARTGASSALAVVGEPGIGKTSLLAYAASRASDFTVLEVLGVESEAELPYAALHQLLHPLLGADVPPAVRVAFGAAGAAPADRFAIGVTVLELLADAAEERPLLCILDDAQWFDHESAAALGFAARRLGQEGVALLFGTRTSFAPGVPELVVERLGSDSAREVLIAAFGAASDAVMASAEGNPLALLELAAREREGASPQSSVERSFVERIGALPEASRTALLVAATADAGDLAAIAAAAAELGAPIATLEPAELAGLIRLDAARVEFRHPLVRSAALAAASFQARQRAHRALADALTAPEDADRRAWHLSASSIGVDESVADELAGAADRARARGGYAAASLALERAGERTGDAARRRRWLVESAEMAFSAGRFDRTERLLDDAEAVAGPGSASRRAGDEGAAAEPGGTGRRPAIPEPGLAAR
ncbi:ATP-binding protein, partial [Solirubrobacter ginsenosidimutans]